ncbi:hypothetical protein QYM36_018878 [Artemia franciscana]|uniref:Uncharacterized protein n=1 Tax=Artemia franciscana TaxID=6661 RepID=A0AA88HBU5_ARTSF|nr:hypothetical protein QYM36_018878 [Artemia franciscana]
MWVGIWPQIRVENFNCLASRTFSERNKNFLPIYWQKRSFLARRLCPLLLLGLEEREIEVLQETISVLKKDLSAARAEIAAFWLDLTNAKSYRNMLENHIELKESSEVTDHSLSKLNQKIISIHTDEIQLFGNDPQYQTQLLMM